MQHFSLFLLYYPLKQGLKLPLVSGRMNPLFSFLLYYPLKQGLKLNQKIRQFLAI